MSKILKAHTNKYRWLASALDDDKNAPAYARNIVVLNGKATASNGALVHVLPTPDLEDGLYRLMGLKLKKIGAVNVPPEYNPLRIINEVVLFNQKRLESTAIQDLKPAYFKTILKSQCDGCMFNRDFLLKATNHSERNIFEVMAKPSMTGQSFAFGVNEFGTFFLVGLNRPTFIRKIKLIFFGGLLAVLEKVDDIIVNMRNRKSK